MNIEKILKTAEYVFEGYENAAQIIDYIRTLEEFDKRNNKQPPVQNAIVQMHASGVQVNSPHHTLIEKTELETLNIESKTLAEVRKKLGIAASEDVIAAVTELLNKNSKCQLDERGKCAFCEKRFLLTTSNVDAPKYSPMIGVIP